MDQINFEPAVWHECGRVVYAYHTGYHCDGIEIPDEEPGHGISKMNGGDDNEYIQMVFGNREADFVRFDKKRSLEIARKLLKIYGAATCSRIYLLTEGNITTDTEIDIPGQDMKYINILLRFLGKHMPGYQEGYLNETITEILKELRGEDVRKSIRTLANAVLKQADRKINRYTIEDALMQSGFRPSRRSTGISPVEMTVKEDHTPSPKQTAEVAETKEDKINDILKKFLRSIKRELNEEEIEASVHFLKDVFKGLR